MTIDLSPGPPFPDVDPTIERHGSANPWPWDRFDLGGGS